MRASYRWIQSLSRYGGPLSVPQGKAYPEGFEDGGTFKIMGSDEGEPGIDDEFFIKLKAGSSTVSENGGVLLGGNIQVHDDE